MLKPTIREHSRKCSYLVAHSHFLSLEYLLSIEYDPYVFAAYCCSWSPTILFDSVKCLFYLSTYVLHFLIIAHLDVKLYSDLLLVTIWRLHLPRQTLHIVFIVISGLHLWHLWYKGNRPHTLSNAYNATNKSFVIFSHPSSSEEKEEVKGGERDGAVTEVDGIKGGLILVTAWVLVSKVSIFSVRKTLHMSLRWHIIYPFHYGAMLWISGGVIQAAYVKFVEIKCLLSKSLPKMDKSKPELHL